MGFGALAALTAVRPFAAFEYGVSTRDPLSWFVVLLTLGLTAVAASWRPARRAMNVDPAALLRQE
jgi:ABC-type lipoprotein release transport system permease subunit